VTERISYKQIDEINHSSVTLTTDTGELKNIPNDVVFVLIGSDADLTCSVLGAEPAG
jgi:hypothetical protein